jgi:hypothetical protein
LIKWRENGKAWARFADGMEQTSREVPLSLEVMQELSARSMSYDDYLAGRVQERVILV